MTIYSGSRYSDAIVDYFTKEEYGPATPVVIYKFDSLKRVSYFTHIYTTGETLHGLSQKYFRRPDLWWAIAEYNPEVVDFTNIASGTLLRIPSV